MKLLNQLRLLLDVSLVSGDVASLYQPKIEVTSKEGTPSIGAGLMSRLLTAKAEGKWLPKISLLPDVSEFKVGLKPYNPILLASGIMARYPSDRYIVTNRNKKLNRYLLRVYSRLLHIRELNDGERYWRVSSLLIHRSHVYLILCLHGIDRNLYRKLTRKELEQLLLRLNKLRRNIGPSNAELKAMPINYLPHYIKYSRTYIPKGSTHRPLGVPSLIWRVYLRMWLMPILGYLDMPSDFHGFLPQRGTGTALKALILNILPKRNIWEIDFKGFFPSIPTVNLTTVLKDRNFPVGIRTFLFAMNNSIVRLRKVDGNTFAPILLEENQAWSPYGEESLKLEIYKESYLRGENFLGGNIKGLAKRFYYNFLDKHITGELWFNLNQTSPMDYGSSFYDFTSIADQPAYWEDRQSIGLPQGSPLSPLLSILYLDEVLKPLRKKFPSVEMVVYADDIVFGCDNDLEFEQFKAYAPQHFEMWGIKISFEKSQVSKTQNSWLYPIKFLGVIFTPLSNGHYAMMSSTRKGRSLELENNSLLSYSYIEQLLNSPTLLAERRKFVDSFKPTPLTQFYLSFYDSIKKLIPIYIREAGLIEWGYMLSTMVRRPWRLFSLLRTGAIHLRDSKSIIKFIETEFEPLKSQVLISEVDPSSPELETNLSLHKPSSKYSSGTGFKPLIAPPKSEADSLLDMFVSRLSKSLLPVINESFWHIERTLFKGWRFKSLLAFSRQYLLTNLVASRHYGLILSRLYIGSWTLKDYAQELRLHYREGSLASLYDGINTFTGSSYAVHDLVRLSRVVGKSGQQQKLVTLSEVIL